MKRSRKQKAAPTPKIPPPKAAPATVLGRQKLWAFRALLALGLPAALLVGAELTLRLAGFGYPTGFFLPAQRDGQKVLVQNNQFTRRFFGAAMARLPEPVCLPRTKDAHTVRIVVFGESAALGDPQPRFGLPRMLQALLELRHPGTRFEVVNAGIVAINSNVVLPIARDCAGADADIWVVYMGNNEVVGPYGAGTVFGQQALPLPLIRATLALKATRTAQLLETLRAQIQKPPLDRSEWGGMEMFLDQQVPAQDPRMPPVYDHFARNLADLIQAGRAAGARVAVSTVAVNLRDCAPFASAHRPGLGRADQTRWEALYAQGIHAEAAGKTAEAAEAYRQAAAIDGDFAELHFRQANCALALGQAETARQEFTAARDLDTLRFRCDSRLNDLIRQTVAQRRDPGVALVDAEQALAAHSPDALPGDRWFYEHVHLTFAGNYLLATTLAPQVEQWLPGNLAAAVPASRPWPSEADCARRLAYSDWDKQDALANMYDRLNKPPFTGQLNNPAKLQTLRAELNDLVPATQPAGLKAAENLCQNALAAAPDDALLRSHLAALQQQSGDLDDALTNAQRALDLLPASADDASQLGTILARQHRYAEAATAFRRAFQLNPRDAWDLQYLAQSLNDLGQQDQAIREFRHVLALNPRFGLAWLGIGQIEEKMGRQADADACYRRAVQNPIKRVPELKALAHFCELHGWRDAAATNYADALQLNPTDPAIYLEAGRNLADLGRHAEAARDLAEAARLEPNLMQAHFLCGLELGALGRPAEAAEQFRAAVRLAPGLPEARINLALALENAGNYSEALEQFLKILDQNPANPLAQAHAQALRQKIEHR